MERPQLFNTCQYCLCLWTNSSPKPCTYYNTVVFCKPLAFHNIRFSDPKRGFGKHCDTNAQQVPGGLLETPEDFQRDALSHCPQTMGVTPALNHCIDCERDAPCSISTPNAFLHTPPLHHHLFSRCCRPASIPWIFVPALCRPLLEVLRQKV